MTRKLVSGAIWALGVVALVIGVCWSIVLLVDLSMHAYWPRHEFGYRTGDGNLPHYLFYSGFGSIIIPPLLNVLGISLLFMWHNQCSVGGCYWYARRKTAAGDRACWLHHPRDPLTLAQVHERHRLHLAGQPERTA